MASYRSFPSVTPIWRLSRIIREERPPSLADMYRITDSIERRFKAKLDPRDIFFELGRRKVVAGQEDIIIEVALALSRKNGS